MRSSFKAIYASLFVATAAAMLGMGIIEPILPLYARSMGATGLALGVIFSGFALSRGIFAPIIGQYSDSKGRRKMMLIGLCLSIILSIAYTWADTPVWLMLIRCFQGFATVLITPIAQSYIGDITPEGKEGKYMNLFFMSFFGGQAIGPAMGGYLSDQFSIAMPFYAMATMSVIALILVFFLVPESPETQKSRNQKPISIGKVFSGVMKDTQMQGIMALMGSRGFYRWGFNTFFPVLAIMSFSMSKTQVGIILSFYMIAGALIQYPAGLLSDRFITHRREIIFFGSFLSPVMMFLVPLTGNFYLLILITLMMGLFSAIGRASAVAIRTERGRVHGMGAVTGAFATSLSVGQVLGPLAFGAIADLLKLTDAFYIGGIIGLVGSVMSYLLLRREKRSVVSYEY